MLPLLPSQEQGVCVTGRWIGLLLAYLVNLAVLFDRRALPVPYAGGPDDTVG
jgi:hypothetical protein